MKQQFIFNRFRVHIFYLADLYTFNPLLIIYKFVSKPAPVTNEISVHSPIVPAHYAPQGVISFTCNCIAPGAAVNTDRRSIGEIPFTCEMIFQRLIREDTCRTNFNQIPAEFTLQRSILMPSKIDIIP